MRVVAYSIKSFEKEPLAIANQKKHDITLISNPLSAETAIYAEGKEAVIVFSEQDDVSEAVINKLADLGVKYIATRSSSIDHIDQEAALRRYIKIANVPQSALLQLNEYQRAEALANETINSLDKWEQNKCLGITCACMNPCKKKSDI